jgi:hypothetical protein
MGCELGTMLLFIPNVCRCSSKSSSSTTLLWKVTLNYTLETIFMLHGEFDTNLYPNKMNVHRCKLMYNCLLELLWLQAIGVVANKRCTIGNYIMGL